MIPLVAAGMIDIEGVLNCQEIASEEVPITS